MAKERLPGHMMLAYKQYKQDSEFIARWLAENSARAGYKPAVDQDCLSDRPKLKGRARKLARDAAKARYGGDADQRTYLVKTSEFTKMARVIVTETPKQTLSRSMQSIWKRAIRVRRKFVDWSNQHSDCRAADDDGHAHFANVLEQSLNILTPCWEHCPADSEQKNDSVGKGNKPQKTSTVKDKDKDKEYVTLENMFNCLDLEDTTVDDSNFDSVQMLVQETSQKKSSAKIELDESELESEFFLAIWLFVMSIYDVRLYIQSVWILYITGKIELTQAATVTNMAIDLIRHAEAEFGESLKRPSKYPPGKFPSGSLPSLLFYQHLPKGDEKLRAFDPSLPNGVVNCGCPIYDILLHLPYTVANIFVHTIREVPITFPNEKIGEKGCVPAIFLGSSKYNSRKVALDDPNLEATMAFADMLPHLASMSVVLKKNGIEDETLHAIRHVYQNHAVPIWVSIALQLDFDIRYVCLLSPGKAWQDLKNTSNDIKTKHDQHRLWITKIDHPIQHSLAETRLQGLVNGMDMVANAWCSQRPEDLLKSTHDVSQFRMETTSIESFPLTCGTFAWHMNMHWHYCGLKFANETGHLRLLCQLYNAVQIAEPTLPRWPDVELVITVQGHERLFFGIRPTTLVDAEKKMWLFDGLSLMKWKLSSRFVYESMCRSLEESLITKSTMRRFGERDMHKIDEMAAQLQRLVLSAQFRNEVNRLTFSALDELAFDSLDSRPDKKPQSSIVDVLKKFYSGFQAEMSALMIDYFAMTRDAFSIFMDIDRIMLAEWSDLPKIHTRKSNDVYDATMNTLTMMRNAAESEEHSLSQRKRRRPKGPHRTSKDANIPSVDTPSRDENVKLSLSPAANAFYSFLSTNKGDSRIRELRMKRGSRHYGSHLFSPQALEKLYGLDRRNDWADLVLDNNQIETLKSYDPGSAANIENAKCLQSGVRLAYCGPEKRTSLEASVIDFGCDDFRRLVSAYMMEKKTKATKPKNTTEKEDWEHYGDIFGGKDVFGAL